MIPANRQPIKPQLNRSHPAYRQLVFAVALNQPTIVDTVHGLKGAVGTNGTGVNPAPDVSPKGKSFLFDGLASYFNFGTVLGSSPISTSTTVLAYFNANFNGTDNFQRIIDYSDGGGGANGFWMEVTDDSSRFPTIGCGYRDGANVKAHAELTWAAPPAFWKQGGWNTACISLGKNSESAGHAHIYINGSNARDFSPTFNEDTAARADTSTNTNGLRIGTWNHTTAREFDGRIGMVATFSGLLPETVVRSLSINPWQIWQGNTVRLFPGTPAVAGGSIVPLVMHNFRQRAA